MRMLALMAVTATVGVLAVGANAAAQQTGTLVVRLVTDPAPPGVTWKYSGAGSAFKLGGVATEHTVALQPGTYQLHETGGKEGAASHADHSRLRRPERRHEHERR